MPSGSMYALPLPIRSPVLRREYVGEDTCPDCGHDLNTGKQCTNRMCDFDGYELVPARFLKYRMPRDD